MYRITGNRQALEVAEGMGQWTKRWVDPLSDEAMARVMNTEFGGMPDSLFELYRITGNADYAAAARRFEHKRVLDPLAEGRDQLKGLHCNTQIPKIIGTANAFEATGDARYRRIAEYFWSQVTGRRCYCTGGTSNFEHWRTDPDELSKELSDRTQECCCTYNMLKLTRHLYTWTADPRYAEYYERALFNGILGTIAPEDGLTMYFVPLAPGYWKIFGRPFDSFWCCTGSGAESFSKTADSIYFHDDAGVWVNLFIASTLDWKEKGVRIRQQTGFPDEASSALLFTASQPTDLELRLRVPGWAANGYRVRINGKNAPGDARPNSYFTIRRKWKTGDRIDLDFPMEARVAPMPDDPSIQAYLYGPIVLAGDLGSEGLTPDLRHGTLDEKVSNHFVRGKPVDVAPLTLDGPAARRIRREDAERLRFRFASAGAPGLMPLNRIVNQRYAVYWRTRSA